ncbi:MAG: AI-2E family transporter [Alphaproteobacteria bacterium]|nr:AI-2E family transporter [Alphaproteobacteria bacterium]
MTFQKQVIIWTAAFAVLIMLLWLLGGVMLPFIAGLVLAYFLDPVADALERLGLPRLAATLVILICAILILVTALIIIAPVLADQIGRFASDLPNIIRELVARFDELAPNWLKAQLANTGMDVQGSMAGFAGKAAGWILALLSSIWSGGMALVNLVSLLVVTPIVAFYMLEDWDRMVAKVDSWLPRDHAPTIRALASEIDQAMAGFIRGQGTVCILLGAFYAIGLSLAGLKFGLAIGLFAGFLTFIPYAGAMIGGILAIGVGLVQFWPDIVSILLVVGVFAVGQFLEGNFLSPKLVGKSVGLHPVWLMFALLAFGYLFGFAGLLLAVPLAAAAGVLVRFGLRQYLTSKLYLGETEDAPQAQSPSQPANAPQIKGKRRKS